MVIYMDQYRQARKTASAVAQPRSEEEPMCVNWNPIGGMSTTFCYHCPDELSPRLPDDLAAVDVDAFVDRVYGLASQI